MKRNIFRITMIISFLLFTELRAQAATLTHHYTFDDGTAKDFAGTLNGTIYNNVVSATNTPPGVNGKSMGFRGAGNDRISLGLTTNLIKGSGTISMWAICTNFTLVSDPVKSEGWLFIAGGSTGGENRFFLMQKNTKFQLSYGTSLGNSTGTIPLNKWVLWTAVWSPSGNAIYTNGVFLGSNTGGITVPALYGNAVIGQNWRGYIDDVRIYNAPLSRTAISNLFRSYQPQLEPKAKKKLPSPLYFTGVLEKNSVTLSWTYIKEATHYHLYRSMQSDFNESEKIVELSVDELFYIDTIDGSKLGYYYWLCAINENTGESSDPILQNIVFSETVPLHSKEKAISIETIFKISDNDILFSNPISGETEIFLTIINPAGKIVYSEKMSVDSDFRGMDIKGNSVTTGLYLARISSREKTYLIKGFVLIR